MGYYTQFSITVQPPEKLSEVMAAMASRSDYFECFTGKANRLEPNEVIGGEWKWYSCNADCLVVSKEVTDCCIRVEGIGEDRRDHWVCFFRNGEMQEIAAPVWEPPLHSPSWEK